jgi:sentrin-specific protease 1
MSVSRFLTTGKVNHFLADEEKNDVILIDDSDEETGEADSDLYMDGKKVVDKKEDAIFIDDSDDSDEEIGSDIKHIIVDNHFPPDIYNGLDINLIRERYYVNRFLLSHKTQNSRYLGRLLTDAENDLIDECYRKGIICKVLKEAYDKKYPDLHDSKQNKLKENEMAQKLAKNQIKQPAKNAHNIVIPFEQFCDLLPLEFESDTVINFFFNLITKRNKEKNESGVQMLRVWNFNSFFYTQLTEKTGAGQINYNLIQNWTKKCHKGDIFSYQMILIPIHLGIHWATGAINFKKRRFEYYDSLGKGEFISFIQNIRLYVDAEHLKKHGRSFDFNGWQDYTDPNCPQQVNNGTECGEFACRFAEYISREAAFNFSLADMTYFRRRHVLEIMQDRLLDA